MFDLLSDIQGQQVSQGSGSCTLVKVNALTAHVKEFGP